MDQDDENIDTESEQPESDNSDSNTVAVNEPMECSDAGGDF